ncbi:MAG: HAD-IA family hydrolase [Candidatus Woesearchaeota archaeon]
METKVVLFDADGVLIKKPQLNSSQRLERNYGIPSSKIVPFYTGVFQDCQIGKKDLREVLPGFLKDWGWKGTIDKFLKEWFEPESHVNKELMEMVQTIRKNGIKCYLATNNEKYRTEYIRNQMGFGKLLDGIISSAEIGCKKPAAEFFQRCISTAGVEPNTIMYFDDQEENFRAGSQMGMQSFLYKRIESFKDGAWHLLLPKD